MSENGAEEQRSWGEWRAPSMEAGSVQSALEAERKESRNPKRLILGPENDLFYSWTCLLTQLMQIGITVFLHELVCIVLK